MDVIVIGAGVIGSAVARAFSRSGAAVTVLDRGAAAAATSARCEGNLLVSDKGPGPELTLAQHSIGRWRDLAVELADELGPAFPSIEYEPKGGIVVATTDDGAVALREFAGTQRPAGVRAEELTAGQARDLEPDLTERAAAIMHYPQDAQVQPVVATEALLASARRAGARVVCDAEVVGAVRRDGALAGVRTTKGDFHAPLVVLAAGPWSGEVSRRIGAPVPVLPRRGMLLVTAKMPQRVFHKVYDADYVGAVGSGDAALQTSTVVESTGGGTVLIGSSRQRCGFETTLDVSVLGELAGKAIRLFPFLAGVPVIRSYGGFRPYLPDHLPMIGADPRLPGLWHASGHEGAGIGLAPATAELLVAQATGAATVIDPAPCAVGRASLAGHLAEAA